MQNLSTKAAWELYELDRRHINTTSDSEVLLNVFANELALATQGHPLDEEALFKAVSGVHKRVKGSYAVVCMIAGPVRKVPEPALRRLSDCRCEPEQYRRVH